MNRSSGRRTFRSRPNSAFLLPLLASVLLATASAQQTIPPPWQGEWGDYKVEPSHYPQPQYTGRAILITQCSGPTCHAEISTQQRGGNCGGSGALHLDTATDATLTIKPDYDSSTHRCNLKLRLDPQAAGRAIAVTAHEGDCSYFCTPDNNFEGTFPFRGSTAFYGSDTRACFIAGSPARAAICNDQALAVREKSLLALSMEVGDLLSSSGDQQVIVQKDLGACDTAPDPKSCLTGKIDTRLADLQQKKSAWIASVNDAGNPEEAARKITAIAGRYRHSFANGDVQGDTFTSHDTLTIRRATPTGIEFKVHTEFFNGHECGAEGIAEYKRNGSFVYHAPESDIANCYLEITPTAKGVTFADPTGQCRLATCGARGGWGGTDFPFTERIRIATAPSRQAAKP